MRLRKAAWALISGLCLALTAPGMALAEGTFEIPAGAHFNPQKLQRIDDYFRDLIANGKIPGAILLISQHGKPIYHSFIITFVTGDARGEQCSAGCAW